MFDTTSQDERSARRRGLYLHNIQYSLEINIHAPTRFEPAIPAGARPQTYAVGRTDKGIAMGVLNNKIYDFVLASSLFATLNQNESVSTIQKQSHYAT